MKNISDIIKFSDKPKDVDAHPTLLEKCITGQPIQTYHNYYRSENKNFHAGVWDCEPGHFRINFTEHEFIHMLKGKIIVRDLDGNELVLLPNMQVVIPAGFRGTWEIPEPTTKLFVNYEHLSDDALLPKE